ncbi:MAG TPA: hypothetical protein VF663_05565 [Telluria sp.]
MLSAPFAHALAAGRTGFNDRVARAIARDRTFDADAFGAFLVKYVDPLVAAVAAGAPPAVAAVADAAFDLALAWVGRGAHGSARAQQLWAGVAPPYATLVAAEPRAVMAMLDNALAHLHTIDGARPQQWVAEMAAIAPDVATLAQLRAVGQVRAWRAGAVHFRQGAIAAADALPAPLACAAFGARDAVSWPALRQQLQAVHWWRAPDDVLGNPHARLHREVGAFQGFGGAFPMPPQVRACAGGFLVRAGERCFILMADAYGAVLHPLEEDQLPAAAVHFAQNFTLVGTQLQAGSGTTILDLPADGLEACCNDTSIAVTSPWTHAIRVLALA